MRAPFWAVPLLLSATAASAEATRVGVAALDRRGEADPAYSALETELRESIERLTGHAALDLSGERRCEADAPDCWRQLVGKAPVDAVVRASVERSERGYQLALVRFDRARGLVAGPSRRVAGGAPDLLAVAELALCELLREQLFPGDRCEGELSITGPAGSTGVVDGREVGAAPWTGAVGIGRHAVAVRTGAVTTPERYVRVSHRRTVSFAPDAAAARAEDTHALRSETAAPASPPADTGGKTRPRPRRKDSTGFDELPPIPDLDDEAPATAPTPPAAVAAPASQPPPTPAKDTPPPEAQPRAGATASSPASILPQAAPTRPPASKQEAGLPPETRPGSAQWLSTAFRASLVTGGVGFVGGLAAGLMASAAASEANAKFDARALTPADAALYDSARTRASVANVAYGLGTVGLLAAAVLYLVAPSITAPGAGGDVGLTVAAERIAIHGSFR
jgi:hypothetical protein